jgi:hypothetical protein
VFTIPAAGSVAAFMEVLTRLPGGAAIVVILVSAIATVAFTARGWQVRRVRTPLAAAGAAAIAPPP